MLILTRRLGETLVIGDDIQVRVMGVRGSQVRIGIAAPYDVPVHREEIYRRIDSDRVGWASAHHRTAERAGTARQQVCGPREAE